MVATEAPDLHSSIAPANGQRYATRFPVLPVEDMVRAQFRLVDAFGIRRLYARRGSRWEVCKVWQPWFCSRSGWANRQRKWMRPKPPVEFAMRHAQRRVLMMNPNWSCGFYFAGVPPHSGTKLAREIATVTYRSGPEWKKRFGRRRADPSKQPALCPDFLIETYLDHAGEKFCLEYDANSLLYVSKAMDLLILVKSAR